MVVARLRLGTYVEINLVEFTIWLENNIHVIETGNLQGRYSLVDM